MKSKTEKGWGKRRRSIASATAAGAIAFGGVCGLYAEASWTTNDWTGVASSVAPKRWLADGNWSASRTPTAGDLTRILLSDKIVLASGENSAVGSSIILAGTRNQVLDLRVEVGAELAFVGADNVTEVNTPRSVWFIGNTANRFSLDVSGKVVLGQKTFSLCGNQDDSGASAAIVPSNVMTVRNGGCLSVTNGTLMLYGGNAAGAGAYTNEIVVLAGGRMELKNRSALVFGSNDSGMDSGYPYGGGGPLCGGGRLLVKGGVFDASSATIVCPVWMWAREQGQVPEITVSDGGIVDLGGHGLAVCSTGTNIVRATSGGVITNFYYWQDYMGYTGSEACYHTLFEASDGGRVHLTNMMPGWREGGNSGRPTFRSRGPASRVVIGNSSLPQRYVGVHPYYNDLRLTAHTPRGVPFPVMPLTTETPCYQNPDMRRLQGYHRLSPDGGVQLVHTNTFDVMARCHDGFGVEYRVESERAFTLLGEDLWTTNSIWAHEGRWVECVGYDYAYALQVTLRPEAEIADGIPLAVPVPRAWYRLPAFQKRHLDPNRYSRVSVRLALEAPNGQGIDVDALVSKMVAQGQPGAVADDSIPPYNVRIDLPQDELVFGESKDRVVMDFVEIETYPQAAGCVPPVTNALIRAVWCETRKIERGCAVIIR